MSFYKKLMVLVFIQLVVVYGLFFFLRDYTASANKIISKKVEQMEQMEQIIK